MAARPGLSLVRHVLLGALAGLLICAGIGGLEGLRQAWLQLMKLGNGRDAGVFFFLFGPVMAGGYFFAGAAIGAGLGACAGAALGAALGTARAATASRPDVWGRRATWRVVHAAVWGVLVAAVALRPDMFDRTLVRSGLIPWRDAAVAPAATLDPAPPEPPKQRFRVLPEGRVLDTRTNRAWMQRDGLKLSALAATRFCKAATMDVPTVEQLKELLVWQADGTGRIAIDAFAVNEDDAYWTRSPSGYRNWLWTVRLSNGAAEPAPDEALHAVRCQVGQAPP